MKEDMMKKLKARRNCRSKFSEIVIKERLKQYKQATNEIEFYDRGIIDSFAYLLKDKISLTEEWITIAKEHLYYKKVLVRNVLGLNNNYQQH